MLQLDALLRRAIVAALGAEESQSDPLLKPSANPQHGDVQANGVLPLAKRLGRPPHPAAAAVLASAQADPAFGTLVESAEVAGPGFINLRLAPAALAAMVEAFDGPDLGIRRLHSDDSVVIDLCGVNVAKQMHVGHLRATIIGDTLARVHERLGLRVWRENHLGDWGLPIAMTLSMLRRNGADLDALSLSDLDAAYKAAQKEAEDPAAAAAHDDARTTLVRLQAGDPELVRSWEKIIDVTMREVFTVAGMLGVTLGPEHSRGESFFRERLGPVVESFQSRGLAAEDQGAVVVRFQDRERPLLIRKKDGGFLYATTDLAAVRFRVQELRGAKVVYVVDARQRDHFKDVFDAVRMIGWDVLPDGTHARLIHVGFGTVLGKDKRPLKTRSGEHFTLKALLEEAIERGVAEVTARAAAPEAPTHGMAPAQLAAIGAAVGIAAVKYADLGSDVARDYVFDLDRMVSFDGDTGPYIQYAHARIAGILAKAGADAAAAATAAPVILEPAERRLVLHLLQYPRVVAQVADSLEPNRLCNWLHSLAEDFNGFYQACPVLKCPDDSVRRSRLRLCGVVKRALADGLSLLGISAPDRM